MNINLKEKSTDELKVLVYDFSKQVMNFNKIIEAIEKEIQGRPIPGQQPLSPQPASETATGLKPRSPEPVDEPVARIE